MLDCKGKSKWPLSHKIHMMVFWVLLWGEELNEREGEPNEN